MGGQALDAFGAKRGQFHMLPPEAFTIIGLDTKDGPEHPYWDERINEPEPTPEEVANVQRFGVRVPVEVVKDGNRLIVNDGRQRIRRARKANAERKKDGRPALLVKCIVVAGKAAENVAAADGLNNARREDSDLVKGRKCHRQVTLFGASVEELAVSNGVHVNTVKRWMSLVGTADATQDALEKGEVTSTQASQIAKLPHAEQKAAVEANKKVNEERKARVNKGPKAKGANGTATAPKVKAQPYLRMVGMAERVHSKEVRAAILFTIGVMPEEEARTLIRGFPDKDTPW